MTKFISSETVIAALRALTRTNFRRTGRTAAAGYLLLKAKEETPESWMEIGSIGPTSVEDELKRYLRVAPGTPSPDVNPFGSMEGTIEYLAEGYERRGTYTHLYPGRNLSAFLDVEQVDRGFRVRIPNGAAQKVAERLGAKIALEPCAAFFMRAEPFPDEATATHVVERFLGRFHLTEDDRNALFAPAANFEIEFTQTKFIDGISSLPLDLQPKSPSASHAAAARAAKEVTPLAKPNRADLIFDETLRRRVRRAVATAKAVALVGPPGTAKSALWAELLEDAAANPGLLGLKRPPQYLSVTAEVDWTARTIIGGYYPDEQGRLVFREGFLLQALKNDQILWVDEMNRADLDRVLGPALTFLAGQSVDLGPTHFGEGAKQMVLAWGAGTESGCKEDEVQRVYYAGSDWRIIGTYNNVDRGRVFPMGAALQRRWALVPVAPVSPELARGVLEGVARAPIAGLLGKAYALHLRYLPIGLAPFMDMGRYISADDEEPAGEVLTSHQRDLLHDAYVLYMGQQLARLDPERRKEFFDELGGLLGPTLAAETSEF